MGGFGSGKWIDIYRRKTSVEFCNELSIKQLRKNGFLDANKKGNIEWKNDTGKVMSSAEIESYVSVDVDKTPFLVVRVGVLSSSVVIKIEFVRHPCNYGGFRYYFKCPAVVEGVFCGNRVTKLFLPPGGSVFGCRHCYDLTYQSCQQSHKYDKVFGHIENADIDSLSVTQALRLGGL